MENNSILNYKHEESVGTIWSVDTGTAIAHIENDEELSKFQINQLFDNDKPNKSDSRHTA